MTEQTGFRERLATRQQNANTLVCGGLDPQIDKCPPHILATCPSESSAALMWMMGVADAIAPYVSMFKPQFAHWLAIPGGVQALEMLIAYLRMRHPQIPVFTDGKPGDIGATQKKYRDGHFAVLGTEGLNPNTYMGKTTVSSLMDPADPGRAIVSLGRTSNPEAWEVQDEMLEAGIRVWERNVMRMRDWSTDLGILANAGVVMGAAHKDPNDEASIYSWHLSRFREIVGDSMWALIPGIGTQGGYVSETVKAAYLGPGSIAINSSSGLSNASQGTDCFEAAALAARTLRDQINDAVHETEANT